jgi:hypothetical protein
LIEETNAAKHYERTKFDLYKDDICLVLTLTYVLMDNFLSLFRDSLYNHDDLDFVGGEKGKKLKALHNKHVHLIRRKKELPILFR